MSSTTGFQGEISETSVGSRLPKHKSAGPEFTTSEASTRNLCKQNGNWRGWDRSYGRNRIATTPGIKIRAECWDKENARSRSWTAAVDMWREWMRDYQKTEAVFTEVESGETVTAPMQNRFMERRRTRLYAKMKDLERGIQEAYGRRLHTVMLTFTASTTSGAGEWSRCPANHLNDLLGAWPAAQRELRRVLDGRRWEYARVVEPHKSGHGHVHVAVFVDGHIRAREFEPVMRAHVNNCMAASKEAHRIEPNGEGAVSVKRGIENLGAYISAYIGGWEKDPLDETPPEQAFNALLWATNRRRVSFSQGAKAYMRFPAPEVIGDWVLSGFDRDGVFFPNDTQAVERVAAVKLPPEGGGLDPPPDRGGW